LELVVQQGGFLVFGVLFSKENSARSRTFRLSSPWAAMEVGRRQARARQER